MTKTAPEAPPEAQEEVWAIDFYLEMRPGSMMPDHIRCDVSHGTPAAEGLDWKHDGIASFDAPQIVLPRVGSSLLPYLIYHISQIRDWLTQEHVQRCFAGQELVIDAYVGIPVEPMPEVP